MRLINGYASEPALLQEQQYFRAQKGLGRHIQQADEPRANLVHDELEFAHRHEVIETGSAHANLLKLPDLIAHQSYQRRYHHGQPGPQKCGELKTERLSPAGGHDRQGIFWLQHMMDYLPLHREELCKAESAFQLFQRFLAQALCGHDLD
jgi:hypothetical protein